MSAGALARDRASSSPGGHVAILHGNRARAVAPSDGSNFQISLPVAASTATTFIDGVVA